MLCFILILNDEYFYFFFIFIVLFNIISCHTDLVYNLILTAEPVILAQTWHISMGEWALKTLIKKQVDQPCGLAINP